jgi:hypothetical protein
MLAANAVSGKRKPYNTRNAIHIYFNTAARTTAMALCESASSSFLVRAESHFSPRHDDGKHGQ